MKQKCPVCGANAYPGDVREFYQRFDAEKTEITGKLFDQINENKKLRVQLVLAKEALTDIEEGTECGWARGRARKALRILSDEPECRHEDYCLHPKCECAKTDDLGK